jgi:hypothetical protein
VDIVVDLSDQRGVLGIQGSLVASGQMLWFLERAAGVEDMLGMYVQDG